MFFGNLILSTNPGCGFSSFRSTFLTLFARASFMKFFGVPTSEGALGKNAGCEKAPAFFAKLFKVEAQEFDLPKGDIDLQQEQIFAQAKKAFASSKGERVCFFGGTHDITFSLFKAFAARSKDAAIVIFDAHADCDEGLSTVSHEDFVRALVEQKVAKPENVLIFGARKIFPSEQPFIEKSGVKISSSEKFLEDFLSKHKKIYFSFDVDVLDPSIMSATHYLENGGLSLDKAKSLVGMIMACKGVSALDIVEFNPSKALASDKKTLSELFGDQLV